MQFPVLQQQCSSTKMGCAAYNCTQDSSTEIVHPAEKAACCASSKGRKTALKGALHCQNVVASQQLRRIGRGPSALMQESLFAACWRTQPAALLWVRRLRKNQA